jgi:hypothetical protein
MGIVFSLKNREFEFFDRSRALARITEGILEISPSNNKKILF